MKCGNCPYWGNGAGFRHRRYKEWMDCSRIVCSLDPRLRQFIRVPFDPHDVKYHTDNPDFMKIYKKLSRRELPDGVRLHKVKKLDMGRDKDTKELRPKEVVLYYYQTRFNHEGTEEECYISSL